MNFGQTIANIWGRERQFTEQRIQQVRDLNFRSKQLEVQKTLANAQAALANTRSSQIEEELKEQKEANAAKTPEYYEETAANELAATQSSIKANNATTDLRTSQKGLADKQQNLIEAQTSKLNQEIDYVQKQLASGLNPLASGSSGSADTLSDDILRITEAIPKYQELYANAKRIVDATDSSISPEMKASARKEMAEYEQTIRKYAQLQARIIRSRYPEYGINSTDNDTTSSAGIDLDLSDITGIND